MNTSDASGQAFDLKAFLDQQRSEGANDSEGVFTVSAEKAQLKLANFSFPCEYDWVLKVIQSVNAWRAPKLHIRQTRQATSFFFTPDQEIDSIRSSSLIRHLTSGTLDNDAPSHMLCMALRSLVDQVKLSFVLTVRIDGISSQPIFAGDDTSQLNEKVQAEWSALKHNGIRLTVSHFKADESFTGRYLPFFTGLKRRDVEIYETIQKEARGSSTPISLDGRIVTDLSLLAGLRYGPDVRALVGGFLRDGSEKMDNHFYDAFEPLEYQQSMLAQPQHAKTRFLIRTMDWFTFHEQAETELSARGYRIKTKTVPSAHTIYWTRNGVVVGHTKLKSKTSATTLYAVLPGEHLRSDLTGLTIESGSEQTLTDALAFARGLAPHITELTAAFPLHVKQAAYSNAQSQHNQPQSDRLGLEAGYSVLTESLDRPARRMLKQLSDTISSTKSLIQTEPQTARNFYLWNDFVIRELKRLQIDLRLPEAWP